MYADDDWWPVRYVDEISSTRVSICVIPLRQYLYEQLF